MKYTTHLKGKKNQILIDRETKYGVRIMFRYTYILGN